jgi:hypothetical protein
MRLDDLIHTLDKADPLDHAYKTRACLAMSYPLQRGRLTSIERVDELPETEDIDKLLEGSPLWLMVEHLYPLPVSQAQ